jgi:hypothetical protein
MLWQQCTTALAPSWVTNASFVSICLTHSCSCRAAGWLASKYRRDLILKCAGGVELVAIGMTSAAILAATHKYMLLCIAVAWWGVAQVRVAGATSPCCSTLLQSYGRAVQCSVRACVLLATAPPLLC